MTTSQLRNGSKFKEDKKSKIGDGAEKNYLKYRNISVSLLLLVSLTFLCVYKPETNLSRHEKTNNAFLSRKILSLDNSASSEWDKLSRRYKIRILDSNVDFQGKTIKFNFLNNLYPQLLKSLTLDQINNVLNGAKLSFGKNIENITDFYLDRRLIHEDARLIRFEFEFGHEFVLTYHDTFEFEKERTISKTFEEFHAEFLKLNLNERSEILNKVRKNKFYQSGFYILNENVFNFLKINSKEMIEQAENDKVLILSAEKGIGKTTTLNRLALEIKNQFPTKWVSFIDLKSCTNLINTEPNVDNFEDLLITILGLNSGFETELFKESFKSDNVVLLWDDFGIVSSEFVSKLLTLIRKNTSNIQFIVVDDSNLNQIRELFNTRALLLIPFDNNERQEFLKKLFKSKNVFKENIEENVKNVNEIIKKLDFREEPSAEFYNPTILTQIANYDDISFPLKPDFIFKIYDNIVNEKIEFWIQQNQKLLVGKSNSFIKELLKRILQKYALLTILPAFHESHLFSKLLKLQIMQIEMPKDFPVKEISQMNFSNHKNEFYHPSFSQFFVAQYLIENIFNADGILDIDEAEIRLELFHRFVYVYEDFDYERIITDFMTSFLLTRNKFEDKNFNPTISTFLRSKFKNFLIRILDTNYPKIFEFLFEFFKKDHNLLVDLLHVNEDETFYTAIFNPNRFALFIDPKEIKTLAQNCLTDQEFDKFVTGNDQKGLIQFGIHFYSLLNITKSDNRQTAELKNLNNKEYSFWEFLSEIKESLTLNEQRKLFVALSSPKIYLYYDKLFNISIFSDYEKLWTNLESLSTITQISDIIGNNFLDYIEVQPLKKEDHEKFSSLLLKKASKFLSNSEIFEMFLNKNIFHEAVWVDFEGFWNFFANKTTNEQQRTILLKNDLDDKNFYFYRSPSEAKDKFSNYFYHFYPYDFTSYNIFHRSLVRPSAVTYNITKEIYQNHFTPIEMQKMILSSYDFIVVMISGTDNEPCERFVNFLEELFKGNEKLLKDYFDQKIYPTNLSLLEFVTKVVSFGEVIDQTNNLKAFNDLYEKL